MNDKKILVPEQVLIALQHLAMLESSPILSEQYRQDIGLVLDYIGYGTGRPQAVKEGEERSRRMSVENHNICKLCDNAKFDKPCPTCTDLAWEGFSIKEHNKQIKIDMIDKLKSNIITHILRSRPLTLEEISNIVIYECEQIKESNNDV